MNIKHSDLASDIDVPSGAQETDVSTHGNHRTHVTPSSLEEAEYGNVLSTAKTKSGAPIGSEDQITPDTIVTYQGVSGSLKGLEAAGLARRDPNTPGGWSFGEKPSKNNSDTSMRLSGVTEGALDQLAPHLAAVGHNRASFLSALVTDTPKAREELVRKLGERGVPREGLEKFVSHLGREARSLEGRVAARAGGKPDQVLAWANGSGQMTQMKFARMRLMQGDPSGYAYMARSAASAGRMTGNQVPDEFLREHKGQTMVDLRKYGLPMMSEPTFDRMLASGELRDLAQKHGLGIRS